MGWDGWDGRWERRMEWMEGKDGWDGMGWMGWWEGRMGWDGMGYRDSGFDHSPKAAEDDSHALQGKSVHLLPLFHSEAV